MQYFVYILECSDKTLYTGYTNNLKKRLIAHNNSKSGAHYTKIRRPVILKYHQRFYSLSKALKKEAYLKKLNKRDKLALIAKNKIKSI